MKLGVFPEWGGKLDIKPFDAIFDEVCNPLVDGWEGVSCILLWGGTDIHPSYYGQQAHRFNQAGAQPSQRDKNEWWGMKYASLHKIPMIGVCRGAQFLCAFAGGQLIQHCQSHRNGTHRVKTYDQGIMQATSDHHQMMYPFDVHDHKVLAYSYGVRSITHEDDRGFIDMSGRVEPEVVWFPKIRALAIQPHPEWMLPESEFVQWCNKEIRGKLLITEDQHA